MLDTPGDNENLYHSVPEEYKTVPTLEMTESGGDIATITCTAKLDNIPDNVKDKLGLNVLFDVGGCMEYTTAVVEVSENLGELDSAAECETWHLLLRFFLFESSQSSSSTED